MKEAIYYFDSSALLKRYIQEEGSDEIEKIWPEGSSQVATAALTYAEIYATFFRLRREGRISGKQVGSVCEQFENDWRTFAFVEFSVEVQKLIPKIIAQVPLRGADLVHIATACFLKERGATILVTYDARMLLAAHDLEIVCG